MEMYKPINSYCGSETKHVNTKYYATILCILCQLSKQYSRNPKQSATAYRVRVSVGADMMQPATYTRGLQIQHMIKVEPSTRFIHPSTNTNFRYTRES